MSVIHKYPRQHKAKFTPDLKTRKNQQWGFCCSCEGHQQERQERQERQPRQRPVSVHPHNLWSRLSMACCFVSRSCVAGCQHHRPLTRVLLEEVSIQKIDWFSTSGDKIIVNVCIGLFPTYQCSARKLAVWHRLSGNVRGLQLQP